MLECFVIQPFDKGPFDKRYADIYKPTIKEKKVKPYRVDRDPGVEIPISSIEAGIRRADLCFADITLDNPNVWFELGFARALRKETVLVCSTERKTNYPFDILDRNIISYQTESPQDFELLKKSMGERIQAILDGRLEKDRMEIVFPKKYYGRWEGWYKETDQDEWYPTAHEISESSVGIEATAYGRHNKSTSLYAYASMDRQGGVKLVWTYDSVTIRGVGDVPDHTGTHIAYFSTDDDGNRQMKGNYFNDRQQFKGRIGSGGEFKCIWVSESIKHDIAYSEEHWPLEKPV